MTIGQIMELLPEPSGSSDVQLRDVCQPHLQKYPSADLEMQEDGQMTLPGRSLA